MASGPARGKLSLAPRTRLNTTVSAQRSFAGTSLPLEALNTARRRHQASLNDAVLAICSGALRRFFSAHPPLPRKSLVAGVPISLRAVGDVSANNQASMTMLSLGTHLADPAARLAHVMAASAAMKRSLGGVKNLLPTDFPSLGVPWVMSAMARLSARTKVADRLPAIVNLTISNVPGPTMPLYMAGARMLSNHPTSIVVHGVALNVTVQTYNDALDIGIIACAKTMPEVAEFARCIDAAWAEFDALVPAGAKAPAKQPAKPRAVAPMASQSRR
jgi:WS/DGAT/MGAT family acyltransferase